MSGTLSAPMAVPYFRRDRRYAVGIQVKLLRVLQLGEITPVGTSSPSKIKVRIIAATNVNARKAIKERRFRDLYYGINVLPIALLPLRQRTEDIELLC